MKVCRILAVCLILALLLSGPAGCAEKEPTEKLGVIRLVGTIGPLSIPLAYMVENKVMASVAETVTLTTWSTPAQLQAIVAGGQGDFISLPTNSAATFYNKGIQLKLLDCSIWNILFLVSTDPNISKIDDLVGKRVIVPYQGAVPDAIFRYTLTKQGINPDKDIEIYYAPDPVQAAQLILSGREKYALLSEPSATSVIIKAKASGLVLYRNLDMNRMWQAASQGKSQSAIAGTIALGSMAGNDKVIKVFMAEYQKAVGWLLANPEEAGKLGAKVLADQGFTADVLTKSAQNIDWRFETASDAHDDIQRYFSALMEVSANFTGGQIPNNAFYYGR